MSRGAFVHAAKAERLEVEAQEAVAARKRSAELWDWCERFVPDLPTPYVFGAASVLRTSKGTALTVDDVRARTEASLRRFFTDEEIAAMKRNGGRLPEGAVA